MPRALSGRLLLYGASGYTGRLIAERAARLGLDLILAGRSAERLRPLAASLGLQWRAFDLHQPAALDAGLADVAVVLLAAGPFAITARPMVEACLRQKVVYLDISGELPSFRAVHGYDEVARERGVMLMPGTGFVVVATDCLAAHVASRLPNARTLRIALARPELLSRGSVRTMLGLVRSHVAVRRDGRLIDVPVGQLQRGFDFGDGERCCVAISGAELLTSHVSTGVANIEVYAEAGALARAAYQLGAFLAGPIRLAPVQALLRAYAEVLPDGPSDERRAAARQVIVAEAEDTWRRVARARLSTTDGYSFTPLAVLAIARRVLSGDAVPGFQTPAGLYGGDFVLALEGTERTDSHAGPANPV